MFVGFASNYQLVSFDHLNHCGAIDVRMDEFIHYLFPINWVRVLALSISLKLSHWKIKNWILDLFYEVSSTEVVLICINLIFSCA